MRTIINQDWQQNTYLVNTKKGLVIIDPGYNSKKIIEMIGDEKPHQILLTHYHFDHVASVDVLCELYDIKAYIHSDDYEYLFSNELTNSFRLPSVNITKKNVVKFSKNISEDIIIHHLPGHSMGSTAFLINNKLFTGDVIFKSATGRVDLFGSSPEMMAESLQNMSSINQEITIYPGHGPTSILGHELR